MKRHSGTETISFKIKTLASAIGSVLRFLLLWRDAMAKLQHVQAFFCSPPVSHFLPLLWHTPCSSTGQRRGFFTWEELSVVCVPPALRLVVWCRHLLCCSSSQLSWDTESHCRGDGSSLCIPKLRGGLFYESLLIDSFKYPEKSFLEKKFHAWFS